MAVLQMQRISICALKHDRKAILEKLQSMGMIEMHQVAQDEAGFEKMDTQSAKSSFEKRVPDYGKCTGCVESVYSGEKVDVRQSGRQ